MSVVQPIDGHGYCPVCGEPLAAGTRFPARYCGDGACRQAAHKRKTRLKKRFLSRPRENPVSAPDDTLAAMALRARFGAPVPFTAEQAKIVAGRSGLHLDAVRLAKLLRELVADVLRVTVTPSGERFSFPPTKRPSLRGYAQTNRARSDLAKRVRPAASATRCPLGRRAACRRLRCSGSAAHRRSERGRSARSLRASAPREPPPIAHARPRRGAQLRGRPEAYGREARRDDGEHARLHGAGSCRSRRSRPAASKIMRDRLSARWSDEHAGALDAVGPALRSARKRTYAARSLLYASSEAIPPPKARSRAPYAHQRSVHAK